MTRKDKRRGSEKKGSWLTYRPDIKVLDCSIRDGGLMTKSHFEDEFVRAVYDACVAAGIDYMELGYKGSKKIFSPEEYGAWKFCDEEAMRRIVGDNPTPLKLAVMADVDRTDYHNDILPKEESVLDMIRVATYIHQIPSALEMIKDAHDKGYETTVNLMAASVVPEHELDEGLDILCQSEVDVIYLVDSFGSLYSEDIQALTKKYIKAAEKTGKIIGIHAHNNQQLAYANTIESLILGASYLDSTMGGLGRGAGNCSTELLLGFLKNPKFKLRPVLTCLQDHINPLKKKVEWGYDTSYMLTGQMNMHPRSAMAFMDEKRQDIVAFFDSFGEDK